MSTLRFVDEQGSTSTSTITLTGIPAASTYRPVIISIITWGGTVAFTNLSFNDSSYFTQGDAGWDVGAFGPLHKYVGLTYYSTTYPGGDITFTRNNSDAGYMYTKAWGFNDDVVKYGYFTTDGSNAPLIGGHLAYPDEACIVVGGHIRFNWDPTPPESLVLDWWRNDVDPTVTPESWYVWGESVPSPTYGHSVTGVGQFVYRFPHAPVGTPNDATAVSLTRRRRKVQVGALPHAMRGNPSGR